MGGFPFLVSIVQKQVSYFGVEYETELLGFGCATEEEAISEAARIVARENAKSYPSLAVKGVPFVPGTTTREHRATCRKACEACKVSGIKDGCKRKKCPECGGLGTVGTEAFSVF